jgi:hypothetical protein
MGVIKDKLRRAVPSIPNSGSRGTDGGIHPHIAFQKITRPAQFTSYFKLNTPKLWEPLRTSGAKLELTFLKGFDSGQKQLYTFFGRNPMGTDFFAFATQRTIINSSAMRHYLTV